MRFLMREQAYERPLVSGQLRYERNGQPTGAVESWRWSAAATDAGQSTPGYRILRVDLDARAAPSGHSYLYNLVQRENGRFEQLKYRFWANGVQLKGNVLLEDEEIIATREVNEVYVSEETAVTRDYQFWFPSSVGLGLLENSGFGNEWLGAGETADSDSMQTITLQAPAGEVMLTANLPWPFALLQVVVARRWGRPEVVRVAGQEVRVRPLTLTWSNQQSLAQRRTVWLDHLGTVLKMERDDGLTAVATRVIRYQG